MFLPLSLFVAIFSSISRLTLATRCIPNPAYTVPFLPASDPLLEPLREDLDSAIQQLLAEDQCAHISHKCSDKCLQDHPCGNAERVTLPLFTNVTSFSIAVTTREEKFWEWHHSAPLQGQDGGSEGRSGSQKYMTEGTGQREELKRSEESWKKLQGHDTPSNGDGEGRFSGRALARLHGGKVVNGSTAYRIASCTKVFTVLALLLQEDVNWGDPIAEWLPELRPPSPLENSEVSHENGFPSWEEGEQPVLMNHVHWDSITLRSLASQLSGIAREYAIFDLVDWVPEKWKGKLQELGFPPLDQWDDYPRGKNTSDQDMSRREFLSGVKVQYPVFAADYQSTYSNTGFVLLGMALEKMSGRKYADVVAERILEPLGMNRTTFLKPNDEDGVIPVDPNDWGWGNELNWPTGGLYSTADDTTAFLRSLLRSDLLKQETTNKWFHVQSEGPGLHNFYGMPWEIFRTSRVASDNRTITVFTKGGGLRGYFSNLALVPEFGLGFSILTAGKPETLGTLQEVINQVLLTGMDRLLQRWTEETYAGTFVAEGKLNSSLELGIAASGGLEVKRWISNGTDFLDVVAKVGGWPPLENDANMEGMQARLFPTGLQRERRDTHHALTMGEVWRIETLEVESPDNEVRDEGCIGDVDFARYAGRAINEMLFYRGENGGLERVQIPVLKVELARKRFNKSWTAKSKSLAEQYGLW